MIKKLRIKFVVVNMCIVTIMLCVILGLIFYFTSANLEMQSVRMMQSIAVQALRPGDAAEQKDVRLPFFVFQLLPSGEVVPIAGDHDTWTDGAPGDALVREILSSPRQFGVISEQALRYYRMEDPARPYLVFTDISSELATLDGLRKTCLVIGGLSFLGFLWVSVLLSKWAVRPVELAWKQQRQFVAAASHELKTPLTVIMTNAQLMKSPEYSPEKQAKFLNSILTMSQQMKQLIEQLLELARADSAEPTAALEQVDLSKVVSDAILPFEPIFFEQGLRLSSQLEENISVHGSAEPLRQVVEILLDNAQKYSSPGGAVLVALKRHRKGSCLLTVSNQGKPIPHESLQDIFKRFYRADPARSRTSSFGLGLSIAETIVTRHRGRIWAESKGGVNFFHVELPCR